MNAAGSPLGVVDGVWAVPMALPEELRRTSWTYIVDVGPGAFLVVDPGWPTEENWATLRRSLASLGGGAEDVVMTFSTHAHLDHIGLAGRISHRCGAPVALHVAELSHVDELTEPEREHPAQQSTASWGVPSTELHRLDGGVVERLPLGSVVVDLPLDGGTALPLSDRGWQVLEVPGHTSGHAGLVHHGRRIVFTGDHLLAGQSPGLGMGGTFSGNPLRVMLDSLDRMDGLEGYLALPGHGNPFRDVRAVSEAIRAHHLGRCQQVERAISQPRRGREKAPSVWDVARQVSWRGGFDGLRANRLRSALHHVDIYREFVHRPVV